MNVKLQSPELRSTHRKAETSFKKSHQTDRIVELQNEETLSGGPDPVTDDGIFSNLIMGSPRQSQERGKSQGATRRIVP